MLANNFGDCFENKKNIEITIDFLFADSIFREEGFLFLWKTIPKSARKRKRTLQYPAFTRTHSRIQTYRTTVTRSGTGRLQLGLRMTTRIRIRMYVYVYYMYTLHSAIQLI